MTHTYTQLGEREREPTYLGTFHTNYIICRNVEIFKRYPCFSKRQKFVKEKKIEKSFGMFYLIFL